MLSWWTEFMDRTRLRHLKEEAAELKKGIRECDEEISVAAAQRERMRNYLLGVEAKIRAAENERA